MFNIYFHVAVMGDWKVSYDIINDYLNKSGIPLILIIPQEGHSRISLLSEYDCFSM
jgi:hypothetical protein